MKHFMIFVLGISLLFINFSFAGDQDGTNDQTLMAHHVGVAAGFVTGYGLSYRHWKSNGHGYQITIAPYVDQSSAYLSLGITGLKIIHIASFANLFVYYGLHFNYSRDKYDYDNTVSEQRTIIVGGGPGFEMHYGPISLNLMFGLAGRYSGKNDYGIQITIETGLYYSFDMIKLVKD